MTLKYYFFDTINLECNMSIGPGAVEVWVMIKYRGTPFLSDISVAHIRVFSLMRSSVPVLGHHKKTCGQSLGREKRKRSTVTGQWQRQCTKESAGLI